MEKFRIFDQNSGLTPWKNSDFFTFFIKLDYKKHFYSLESLSFLLEYQLKYISRLIFSKNKQWRNFEFLSKNPFGKIQFFFNLLKKGFYSLQSVSFHLEYQLKYICKLIYRKNRRWKNFAFLTKTVD